MVAQIQYITVCDATTSLPIQSVQKMWKFCKMQKIERVVDVPVVMHWLFPTIQNKKKRRSLSPSGSVVKNQIACLVRIVLCERRLGRKKPDQCRLFSTTFFSPFTFFCNIFSHNISLLQRINSIVCDGRCAHNTTPHAHFSRCLASPCQFACFCGVESLLFTCTTRACGSRCKFFF